MYLYPRAVFAALLLTSLFAGSAGAEITIPVNDNNTGIFDQPSAVLDGATVRVAYIGDNAAPGVFKVYYAAVNANTNFTNLALVKDSTVILTSPTVVDNSTFPNDAYYDARHPNILMRTPTQVVILFQARPLPGDNVFRPYIARLTLSGNTVPVISVQKMIFPSGFDTTDIEDLSFGIVTTDNTARIAFAMKTAIDTPGTFVYFARVGLDNATVVGAPILLSSLDNTAGLRPVPSLRLDTLNQAHIAWAGNGTASGPSPVYYAMIKAVNGVDNLAIAPTQVIGGVFRWSFPTLLVLNNTSIIVLAADETVPGQAGNIGYVNINPFAAKQDGSPATTGLNTSFFYTPPGELVLPDEFNLYHPEATLDADARIHMTGYGLNGTRCTYFAFHIIGTSPYFEILTPRVQVGFGSTEFPGELANNYTRAAFVYLTSGRAIIFWSGANGANRNLDVTSVGTTAIITPAKESGCVMVADPHSGEGARMAGAAFLFLPAVVLAVRRISRRFRDERGRTLA